MDGAGDIKNLRGHEGIEALVGAFQIKNFAEAESLLVWWLRNEFQGFGIELALKRFLLCKLASSVGKLFFTAFSYRTKSTHIGWLGGRLRMQCLSPLEDG